MLSRREVLAALAPAPLLFLNLEDQSREHVQFIEERHILARESGAGFRLLLSHNGATRGRRSIFVVPALRQMTMGLCRELLERVRGGSWLILESGVCFSPKCEADRAAAILQDAFGLRISAPVNAVGCGYVTYSWPAERQVRSFEAVAPISCLEHEVIARWRGLPVCGRRLIGQGSVIYLGSMLGPGLYAEEREAHAIGAALIA